MLMLEDREIFPLFQRAASKRGRTIQTDNDNYLFIEGKQNYCVVAHIDTVAPIKTKTGRTIENEYGYLKSYKYTSKGNKSRTILGADDRAGCFILYCMLCDASISPSILLTNYEECGGQGVTKFCASKISTKHIHAFFEFDRRGCNSWVQYNDNPESFHSFMEDWFEFERGGSFSDIAVISRCTNIPSANIACGYYRQHTDMEYLDVAAMRLALYKSTEMLKYLLAKPTSFGKIEKLVKTSEAPKYSYRPYDTKVKSPPLPIYQAHYSSSIIDVSAQGFEEEDIDSVCLDCGEQVVSCICGSIISANQLALLENRTKPFLSTSHKEIVDRINADVAKKMRKRKEVIVEIKKKGVIKV